MKWIKASERLPSDATYSIIAKMKLGLAKNIEWLDESFFCKEQDKNGHTCEEQCQTCKKAENMPDIFYETESQSSAPQNQDWVQELYEKYVSHKDLELPFRVGMEMFLRELKSKLSANNPISNQKGDEEEIWSEVGNLFFDAKQALDNGDFETFNKIKENIKSKYSVSPR